MPTDEKILGVILTGGKASRLKPLSNFFTKSQIPLLNRPLIAYAIDLLASATIDEIAIVTSPNDQETELIAKDYRPDLKISTHVQATPMGSGDALAACGPILKNRPVVVVAVDTILKENSPLTNQLTDQIHTFITGGWAAWLPLHETERPSQMGIVEINASEQIISIEEKPEVPKSNLALVGIWMLTHEVVDRICLSPEISSRGEIEITGMLETLHRENASIGGRVWNGAWLDTGTLSALLKTQEILLDKNQCLIDSSAKVNNSTIRDNVVVGPNCQLTNVDLKNALVAPGTVLRNIRAHDVVISPDGQMTSVI
jgi:glucose-1-phosphate thymidylyltransferase